MSFIVRMVKVRRCRDRRVNEEARSQVFVLHVPKYVEETSRSLAYVGGPGQIARHPFGMTNWHDFTLSELTCTLYP